MWPSRPHAPHFCFLLVADDLAWWWSLEETGSASWNAAAANVDDRARAGIFPGASASQTWHFSRVKSFSRVHLGQDQVVELLVVVLRARGATGGRIVGSEELVADADADDSNLLSLASRSISLCEFDLGAVTCAIAALFDAVRRRALVDELFAGWDDAATARPRDGKEPPPPSCILIS